MHNNSIAGIGCSLMDYIYPKINFSGPEIRPFLSKTAFDGGLIPGGLVFVEDLERFSGRPFGAILEQMTKGEKPEAVNLGGPAIVALINCSQLLESLPIEVKYFGRMGNDTTAERIKDILANMPLQWTGYLQNIGSTPSTYVFSDPEHAGGAGERMFVNNIGIAGAFTAADVPDRFFNSRVLLFGATALLPGLHDSLSGLLLMGKRRGCVNILTTVFDFRNARKNPGSRWPLGDNDGNYKNIDLLITDHDEALHLSAASSIEEALDFFIKMQTPACLITHGPNPVHLYSKGGIFMKIEPTTLPVSTYIRTLLETKDAPLGDTTGCGDNFAGGVLASIAYQLCAMKSPAVDLLTACAWGIASGGFACCYLGGTYVEKNPGEKREKIQAVFNDYRRQIGNGFIIHRTISNGS
jgi:sugar/nucleoside kinase (ribokinase family)